MTEGRDTGPSLREVETLLRSLVGVAAASIRTARDGSLRQIVVVPAPGATDRRIARNVLSALKARFGIDFDPDAISLSPALADTDAGGAPPAGPPARAASPHTPPVPDAAHANGRHPNGPARQTREDAQTADPGAGEPAALVRPADGRAGPLHGSARPRLEVAELRRAGSLMRCRVVIATGTDRFTGVADTADGDVAEIDLAARVTVDALRAARTPRDPIQFEGAALIDVAGRAHVLASLSIWNGFEFEGLAGAEPVRGTPVEAAALAVLSAVNARLVA